MFYDEIFFHSITYEAKYFRPGIESYIITFSRLIFIIEFQKLLFHVRTGRNLKLVNLILSFHNEKKLVGGNKVA